MSKPIFTVGLPKTYDLKKLQSIQERISTKITDYHILVWQSEKADDIEFNAFYTEDFSIKDFDDLKKLILSNVK